MLEILSIMVAQSMTNLDEESGGELTQNIASEDGTTADTIEARTVAFIEAWLISTTPATDATTPAALRTLVGDVSETVATDFMWFKLTSTQDPKSQHPNVNDILEVGINKVLFDYTLKDINILVKLSKYPPTDYSLYPVEGMQLGAVIPKMGSVMEVSVMDATINREIIIRTDQPDSFAIKLVGGDTCVWKKDNQFSYEGLTDGPSKK